eukprot:297584_1
MATSNQPNQLLTEIEMDDRNDSVDLAIQHTSTLKPCYWVNLSKEQKVIYILLIIIFLLTLSLIIVIITFQHTINTSTNNDCNTNQSSNLQICQYDPNPFIPISNSTNTNNIKQNISDRISNIKINKRPKNLIVMIGDGMGTIYNTAYRFYKNQDRTILDEIFKGRYSTNPLNRTITDSAAGATAFSTGTKTFNGNIATDISGNPLGTILEALKRKGMGTALIATSSVTDATPASFASHVLNRNFENLIAKQLVSLHEDYTWTNCSIIDILLGGGKQFFDPFNFNMTTFEQYGWNKLLYDNDTLYSLCAEHIPIIGLFADNKIPYYLDILNSDNVTYPSLLDMSKVSINLLNKTYYDEGFFMMIEGSRIDSCGHLNDVACIMNEMEQFYDTVEYITKWTENDGETLVCILADHQTGGFTIGRQDTVEKTKIMNGWSLYGFSEHDIIEFYGDYKVNPLVTSHFEDGTTPYLSEQWKPEIIHNISHTSQWFNDTVSKTNNTMNIVEMFELIEQHWFVLSIKEKQFLNYTFVNDGRMDQALVYITNVRTMTGFTTHGHTAVDVSVYAMGVSSDVFIGHWRNDEIGQLLTKIMDCEVEQNEQSMLLQELFVNGTLRLCDPKFKPPIIEWNNSVPYPWNNLLYPQNCVDVWE